jgi:glycosyltransferase involved in cell wall biosynthesis
MSDSNNFEMEDECDNNAGLHVLIIPSWYPDVASEVRGIFFKNQVELLAKYHKINVLYPNAWSIINIFKYTLGDLGFKKNINKNYKIYTFNYINYFPRLNFISSKIWIYFGLRLFERFIKENQMPHIIHAQCSVNAGLLAREIKNKYNIPYVITEHRSNYLSENITKSIIKNTIKAERSAAAKFAVSPTLCERLNKYCQANDWQVLPNFIDEDVIPFKAVRNYDNKFRFIHVSNLSKIKNVDKILSAAAILMKEYNNIILEIIGENNKDLKRMAQKFGIEKFVIFHGAVNNAEIFNYIKNCDAFLFMSTYETFGVALIEAMAVGLPVICTKKGGGEFIVRSGADGYICENLDIIAYYNKMKILYSEYANFNSIEIRDNCLLRFGHKTNIKYLAKIYENLIRR